MLYFFREHIKGFNLMKINISMFEEHNELKKHYMKLLVEKSKLFLKEYDIDENKHQFWPFSDTVGITEFANWLKENSILDATPYWFKDDNGNFVVIGLDIKEDKKFTYTAMKV
jgi:hypothetical protein